MEFDLDHDPVRVEAGLPRVDDSALARTEARLRAAYAERAPITLAASEVEALLAALDTLRSLSSEAPRAELVDDDSVEP